MILLLQPSNRHSTQPKVGEKEEEVGMGCGIQASRFRVLDETCFFFYSNKQARLQYRDRHQFHIQQARARSHQTSGTIAAVSFVLLHVYIKDPGWDVCKVPLYRAITILE